MAKSEKHIVRVFFSSPFGGMEIEREELTKKYWPRLSSMCSRAGFEFVPVDLRWGITSEMSSNASTIEVCLKELDRSDMIIGFFGQRYGWHGDNELLQKSFDVAITKYPWLNEYRDKSVTELEFLHGHLNNPGDRAACFYFRDKAYDDEMLAKYESENNEEESRKYQSITDGEDAAQCLTELKKKVKDTEDKCLQFVEEYPNPEAGAELMFEAIKNHLQTILKPLKKLTEREEKLSLQNAYYASHLGVGANQEYIGGETYLKEVDRHVMKDDENFADKPLLIVGDSGVGKTTLLSNWLHRHQQTHPDDIIAYHFVGCAPKTTSETDVLSRIVEDLKYGYKKKHNEKYEDEKNENVKSEKPKTVLDYYRELQEVLSLINENGYHAVIIIDGVNKMDDIGKTKKELYWLPKDIPKGVSLLISCLKDDISKTDEFNERQFDILSVEKLNTEQKEQMMQAILSLRGKELSSEQKLRLMNKEETENPLYLKILLQELVNFGDFFKLDDHIDYILQANSTTELFMKILERLEKDFNSVDSEDNVVAKVMSCILVSRYGLSDQEIKSIINLPDQLWSSIYFALEDFLIDREGIYGFAYDELSSAVKERYCHGNDNIDMVAAFFENKLKELGPDHRVNIPSRIINELPWLLEKFGDQERLQNCLLHLAIFLTLFRNGSKYDLFGYWNSTELSGEEISSLYMKSIDQQLVNMYLEQLESSETPDHPPAKELLSVAIEIASFLYDAGHFVNAEPLLLRARRMHGFSFSEDEIEANKDACDKYCEIIGNLANLYVDLERFEEGEKLHKENLEMRKNWPDSSTEAMTMNGLGVLYLNQKKFEEAEEYFQKSLEMHQANLPENHSLIASTLNNIGCVRINMGKYEEAKPVMEQSIKIYEMCNFGELPPDLAGCLNNLALCYRNLGQLDEADLLYKKSYDMTVNAVGEKHTDVAEKLINWGVFDVSRGSFDEALQKYNQALEIYKDTFGEEHVQCLKALENIAGAYVHQEKYEEAHPYFKKASETLHKQGRLDVSHPHLNNLMLEYYLRNNEDEAYNLLERIIHAKWATDRMFAGLEYFDKKLPENERPMRPYESTVEYALTKFPSSMTLLKTRVPGASRCGDYQSIIDILDKGDFPHDIFSGIYQAFVQNDYRREGLKILYVGHTKYPEDVLTLHNIGNCHAFYKEYDRAVAAFCKILDIEPNNTDTLISLGSVYAIQGEVDMAKSVLEKALEIAKENDLPDVTEKANEALGLLDSYLQAIDPDAELEKEADAQQEDEMKSDGEKQDDPHQKDAAENAEENVEQPQEEEKPQDVDGDVNQDGEQSTAEENQDAQNNDPEPDLKEESKEDDEKTGVEGTEQVDGDSEKKDEEAPKEETTASDGIQDDKSQVEADDEKKASSDIVNTEEAKDSSDELPQEEDGEKVLTDEVDQEKTKEE